MKTSTIKKIHHLLCLALSVNQANENYCLSTYIDSNNALSAAIYDSSTSDLEYRFGQRIDLNGEFHEVELDVAKTALVKVIGKLGIKKGVVKKAFKDCAFKLLNAATESKKESPDAGIWLGGLTDGGGSYISTGRSFDSPIQYVQLKGDECFKSSLNAALALLAGEVAA